MNTHPIIVVADTDPLFLELMQIVLTDAGYPTLITVEPQYAYPVAIQHQPDVVILEIGPENIGWSTLEHIKLDPRTSRIPVLVCSIDVRLLAAKKEWLTSKGCAYLEKPFTIDNLLAALTPLVGPPPEAPSPGLQ